MINRHHNTYRVSHNALASMSQRFSKLWWNKTGGGTGQNCFIRWDKTVQTGKHLFLQVHIFWSAFLKDEPLLEYDPLNIFSLLGICQDITELLKHRCLWKTDTNQKWGLFHPSYKIKAMMLPHLTSINFLKELVERVMMKEKGIFLWWLFYKFSQSFLSIMYWLLLGENDLQWLQ